MSPDHRKPRMATRKGEDYIMRKNMARGSASIAKVKQMKQIVPATHRTSRVVFRFFGTAPSKLRPKMHFMYPVAVTRLKRERMKARSKAGML